MHSIAHPSKTFWKTQFIPTLQKKLHQIRTNNPDSHALQTLELSHSKLPISKRLTLQQRIEHALTDDSAALELFFFTFGRLSDKHQTELTGKTEGQWLGEERKFSQ